MVTQLRKGVGYGRRWLENILVVLIKVWGGPELEGQEALGEGKLKGPGDSSRTILLGLPLTGF